jgi:amidase
MTRTIKDAAYILQVIAGVDEFDNYTSVIPDNGKLPDYVAACDLSAFTGARIGLPRNILDRLTGSKWAPQIKIFNTAVEVMKDAGAIIVDNVDFSAMTAFLGSNAPNEVLNADFISGLAHYLGSLTSNPSNLQSLTDVRAFTQSSPLEEYPDRNTAAWDEALDLQGYNNTDPRFWGAYQENLFFGGEGGLLGALQRNNLDAIILPSNIAYRFAAIVGAPVVTVPLGVYPSDAPLIPNNRRNLVSSGPNIP